MQLEKSKQKIKDGLQLFQRATMDLAAQKNIIAENDKQMEKMEKDQKKIIHQRDILAN